MYGSNDEEAASHSSEDDEDEEDKEEALRRCSALDNSMEVDDLQDGESSLLLLRLLWRVLM